jgi:L-fuconate dehydratase
VRALCRQALADGWTRFKIKVGRDAGENVRRCQLVREEIGDDALLMVDANQAWEVGEAIDHVRQLAPFRPLWIEEPTSPDDILGHAAIRRAVAPVGVATGEHGANRVLFKQLLQAGAIDYCQLDNCRLGGLNEVLAVLLLAARFGVPVCPHAGGIGLCEYAQHVSIIDYVCISGSMDGRMTEYADHLHEHFVDPVTVKAGRYIPPEAPGFSIEMHPESLDGLEYPTGAAWRDSRP